MPEAESDPTEFVGTVKEVPDPSEEDVAPIELHSDDSQIVLQSVDTEESAERLRLVFEHDGDKVTGIKSYVDYGTVALAQEVAAEIDLAADEDVLSVSVEGSCVVIVQAPETYEGLTVGMLEETYPDMRRI